MTAKEPVIGPGQFQWNAGGWFGSQLGGTAWLVVGAATLLTDAPLVAAWWAACFFAANAIGTVLWLRRDRVRPYPAIQALLAACGLAGLAAVVARHLFGPGDIRLGLAWRDGRLVREEVPGGTLLPAYALMLMGVPGMMAAFASMEWFAVRSRREMGGPEARG